MNNGNIKETKEDIWFWYYHCKRYVEQGFPGDYARVNRLDKKKFGNIRQRIIHKKYINPKKYDHLIEMTKMYLESGLELQDFCKDLELDKKQVTATCTHLRYLNIIEELVKERGEPTEEHFINVPRPKSSIPIPDIPIKQILKEKKEIMREVAPITFTQIAPKEEEKKKEPLNNNEIEIRIMQGVRVFISHEVDSLKVIKIIQMLKDL